jgi:hypothetical protein
VGRQPFWACAATIIPLVRASRPGSSDLPEGSSQCRFRRTEGSTPAFASSLNEPGQLSPPIWSCTARGLPCLRHCWRSGGLLPHLFTLTSAALHGKMSRRFSCRAITGMRSAGGIFSVALSVTRSFLAASPGVTRRVALPCLRKVVSGLSSRQPVLHLLVNSRSASDRPAHPPPPIIPCQSASPRRPSVSQESRNFGRRFALPSVSSLNDLLTNKARRAEERTNLPTARKAEVRSTWPISTDQSKALAGICG